MASNVFTDSWKQAQFGLGSAGTPVDFDADAIYGLLVNSTGDAIADGTKEGYVHVSDINANELPASGGYSTNGQQLTSGAITVSGHVVKIAFANPVWNAAAFTAYGMWIYKRVGGSPVPANDTLIGYFTFAGAITATGGTFTVTINASGLITAT